MERMFLWRCFCEEDFFVWKGYLCKEMISLCGEDVFVEWTFLWRGCLCLEDAYVGREFLCRGYLVWKP